MKSLGKLCTGVLSAAIGVTSVIVVPLAAASPAAAGAPTCTPESGYTACARYTLTGSDQTFTVPAGVTSVRAKLWGAGGGGYYPVGFSPASGGGAGGFTTGTVAVTGGQTLTLSVGGGGGRSQTTTPAGGGGPGGSVANDLLSAVNTAYGSAGGGMSALWSDSAHSTPLLIAGGGGGSGGAASTLASGSGGGAGGGGTTGNDLNSPAIFGSGGTQSAGGAGATKLDSYCDELAMAKAGTQYAGGAGGSANSDRFHNVAGGGGGGGYYGGGGGACLAISSTVPSDVAYGGGGAGGSAYTNGAGVTDASTVPGSDGSFMNADSGGYQDPLYDSGVGSGGSMGDGGSGEIVLEWVGAPSPVDVTTQDYGQATQSPSITVPTGGSLLLLGPGNFPDTSLTVPGQGTYTVDTATNVITFAPATGFTGAADPVGFRVVNAGSLYGDATYTPTVLLPSAPTAGPLFSTGTGTATQTKTITAPAGGSVTLLSGITPTNSVTVSGQGTYTLEPSTGVISFVPVLGFSGDATPVTYQRTDSYAQTGSSTYTPTVNKPAGPEAGPLLSTGTGTATQTKTITAPDGGSVTLLSGLTPINTVTVPGQGTYALDSSTGVISFVPVLGFSGDATPVTYQLTDSYAQTGSSTYTPTVKKPAPPVVPNDPNVFVAFNHTDTLTVPIPDGGQIALLNTTSANTVLGGNGQTWTLDPTSGVITFTPAIDQAGYAGFVYYTVTDAYDQTTQGSYTVYLLNPAAPAAHPLGSTGYSGTIQHVQPVVPAGGHATFAVEQCECNPQPDPYRVVVAEGVYTMDQNSYAITFTPVAGYVGRPTPVDYRVFDAYSQHTDSPYQPVVKAVPTPVVTATAKATAPPLVRLVTSGTTVPVTCALSTGKIHRCDVVLTYRYAGRNVVVGSATRILANPGAMRPVLVPVRLNALGHYLAGLGPVAVTATVTVTQAGTPGLLHATAPSGFVNASVKAATAVYFDNASFALRPGEIVHLNDMRSKLAKVRSITCTGNTDVTGNALSNFLLGMARANAVCAHLTQGTRIAVNLGTSSENALPGSHSTALARQLNRRVDVRFNY